MQASLFADDEKEKPEKLGHASISYKQVGTILTKLQVLWILTISR